MKPTFIALLALCMCLGGCGKKKEEQTAKEPFQGKKAPEKPEPKVDPTKHERFLWEFETGGAVPSSPAIGPDGTVYFGSRDKKLYALSGKSGVKLWEFKTGTGELVSGVHSSPAIGSDGTVYVGSTGHKLYALSAKSGVKLWEFETGHYVQSSPAIGPDGTSLRRVK
jgi:glucose dehydrogenase